MKKLTEEEMDIANAIHALVYNGEIPFEALEPVYKDFVWSKLIEDYIGESKEKERKNLITGYETRVNYCRSDVESTKQQLDKTNTNISGMKAELEEQRSKTVYARDENRIRDLFWWILNSEISARQLEDELREKQANLKDAEAELERMKGDD